MPFAHVTLARSCVSPAKLRMQSRGSPPGSFPQPIAIPHLLPSSVRRRPPPGTEESTLTENSTARRLLCCSPLTGA